ncbi:hypothetical protein CYY_006179 [Polysphondylium violaceum]|uniref:Uncharacterized protein n=1 Tax=Polysphondylium violaceum TaxID=133409 RepID=A0A8J4V3E7_9MYCE|nr:hypothetical protein CYY_006179 [Polysphondylium violaceum]
MIEIEKLDNNNLRFNHPDDLRLVTGNGFGKLKYIRPLSECVKEFKESNTSKLSSKQPANFQLCAPPQLLTNDSVKKSYQTNDWKAIKQLEDKANADLNPIMDNMQNHANNLNCWIKVQDDTDPSQFYYMNWDSKGNYVWCWTSAKAAYDPFNPDYPLSAPVQYGQYSNSTQIAGTHSYKLGLAVENITELVISGIVASFVAKSISKGINFLATDLGPLITEAAAEMGLEFIFTIPTFALAAVCGGLVFALVFIGLKALWGFLNKRFQICVSVYNWDKDNDWQIPVQSLSNGEMPGKDKSTNINLNIPKQSPPGTNPIKNGSSVLPPDIGSQLMHTVDYTLNYAYLIYDNPSTFMQGLGFALKVTKNNTSTGFSYAFHCPWTASNGHYIENTAQDPKSFLDKAGSHWVSSTAPLTTTVEGMPIRCYIDALTGGDAEGSDYYKVAVHIDPSN